MDVLAEKDSPERQNNVANAAAMQRDNTGHLARREGKRGFSRFSWLFISEFCSLEGLAKTHP